MAIDLTNLIQQKIQGIKPQTSGYAELMSAGAIDILEKIKTYKQDDLQKFVVEENVHDAPNGTIWTSYNAVAVYAWEIIGAKRSMNISTTPDNMTIPNKWKTANRLSLNDKNNYIDSDSLKFISNSYPGFTVESHTESINDGDNDSFYIIGANPHYSSIRNYIVTIFPQVKYFYHSWKVQYIPIPEPEGRYSIQHFHVSYVPALAIYVAKNIVLNEMNRLLLLEEDLELAAELKNHYALLEQEYSGLMNIPPKKEVKA